MMFKFAKYFILLAFLTGCAQLQIISRPKAINGEPCIESPRIRVLQVLDEGILAHLCPVDYPSYYEDAFEACVIKGDLVFMSVAKKANDYVDSQKITLTQKQCFIADGTYSYTRSDGNKATVRNIKLFEEKPKTAD